MNGYGNEEVHAAAAQGYTNRAATYQAARPSYHPELIARFVERYGRGQVVDLAAGTGIFTAQLVDAGIVPVAIEPVAAMRETLTGRLAGVEALDGMAEAMPLGDDTADTVVVAQAFHWFAHNEALAEIARVLKPGGALVTVWNVRDQRTEMVQRYSELVNRYEGDTPRHHTMIWRDAIDADDRFVLIDDWHIDNPQQTDVNGVVNRALSTSFIASLPTDEQDDFAAELRVAMAPYGPEIVLPYQCELQAWLTA